MRYLPSLGVLAAVWAAAGAGSATAAGSRLLPCGYEARR